MCISLQLEFKQLLDALSLTISCFMVLLLKGSKLS